MKNDRKYSLITPFRLEISVEVFIWKKRLTLVENFLVKLNLVIYMVHFDLLVGLLTVKSDAW